MAIGRTEPTEAEQRTPEFVIGRIQAILEATKPGQRGTRLGLPNAIERIEREIANYERAMNALLDRF